MIVDQTNETPVEAPVAAPPVEAPVETAPVSAPEATDAPVVETPVEAPVVEEPIRVPTLPGQRPHAEYSQDEVAALQAYVQQAAAQMQQYQQQLRQYEMAELDDDERNARLYQQQAEALSQREAELQEWYARNQWYQYYNQWVPEGTVTGEDPVQWQHSVLSHLYTENQTQARELAKLRSEVEALKRVGVQPAAPKVTTQGGAPAPRKSVWDMSWEEMEALKEAALMGTVSPTDFPGV